jgi:hypothetical protein
MEPITPTVLLVPDVITSTPLLILTTAGETTTTALDLMQMDSRFWPLLAMMFGMAAIIFVIAMIRKVIGWVRSA